MTASNGTSGSNRSTGGRHLSQHADMIDLADDEGLLIEGGEVLSVAEIQHALRELKARKGPLAGRPFVSAQPPLGPGESGPPSYEQTDPPGRDIGQLHVEWVTVVASHAGSGSSMIALAMADAAAQEGRRVQLIETADPARSGLVAAAPADLGVDPTRSWIRAHRGRVTLDRRAPGQDVTFSAWPLPPAGGVDLTLVDLGSVTPSMIARVAEAGTRVIVVCRPTVPGLQMTERVLADLAGRHVTVAAVGPSKWSRSAVEAIGPLLAGLISIDHVVAVPTDRHLEITGPTPASLPKSILEAAEQLLGLLDSAARQ